MRTLRSSLSSIDNATRPTTLHEPHVAVYTPPREKDGINMYDRVKHITLEHLSTDVGREPHLRHFAQGLCYQKEGQ